MSEFFVQTFHDQKCKKSKILETWPLAEFSAVPRDSIFEPESMNDFCVVSREIFLDWKILVSPLSSFQKTIGKRRLTNIVCHDDSLKITLTKPCIFNTSATGVNYWHAMFVTFVNLLNQSNNTFCYF